jgi:hypothetical protein
LQAIYWPKGFRMYEEYRLFLEQART